MCNCVSVSVSKQQRETNYAAARPGVTQHSALLGNYYASPRATIPPPTDLHYLMSKWNIGKQKYFSM